MARVKIWVSATQGFEDLLIVVQDNGSEECYALNYAPGGLDRLGSAYWGQFRGNDGTYYDLPRGFPANNADAAQRLNDPSISNTMKSLIRLNFPLRTGRQATVAARRIA